tara:strand:- start:1420 stop:2109 length:690 start_codon:yes stop_codon:yes gene_type:complete
MARISTYAIDNNVTSQDKVIGTDSSGLVTKNFNLQDLGEFLSKGFVNVNGQHSWQFVNTIQSGGLYGPANGASISSLTTIKLNKITKGDKNIQNFLLEYKSKRILLVDIVDPNAYGLFDVTSITEDVNSLNNYDVELDHISSNGSLTLEKIYAISMYAQDATYAHRQINASATWTINHNLNKFPSVSIKFSSSDQIYENVGAFAGVEYIDQNNLTINLAAAESGYAYLN